MSDGIKLSVYFGERDRMGGRFLADVLADVFDRHELRVSLLMRGASGFGIKHRLRTDRLLTLSEDLPLVAVAVDDDERIGAALEDVEALDFEGLVTLERVRFADGGVAPEAEAKLTVYLGRGERVVSRPAHEAVVGLLREHGVAGATVLLGVDGTVDGVRRRARLLGRNAAVPLMVVSVGDGERVAAALEALGGVLRRPIATLERVRVCRRDGAGAARPHEPPDGDVWQQLTVYCSEQSRHAGDPVYAELVRRLREAGAAGATALRGVWGYHGDHEPHGDVAWQLRRRVPVVVVTVDSPANTRRWFEIVEALTAETGLVTSEIVPAYRAGSRGVLTLAPRWEDWPS